MDLGAIFLLLVVLALVLLYVTKPFTKNWQVKVENSPEVSTLLAERERSLNTLQELDFDNRIGKVPADEYLAQRASLLQKGSEILRRLDEIQESQVNPAQTDARTEIVELSGKGDLTDEELETLVAKRRGMRQQKTAGFCPNCGKPILQSDQFCPSCGLKLNMK